MALDRRARRVKALAILASLAASAGWVLALGAVAPISPTRPAFPQRIVSGAPSITEALFAVGAGAQVVAVSDYCSQPPEVTALPKIGGLYNPRMEALVGLNPDLVVTVTPQRWLRSSLAQLGVASVHTSMNHPSGVPAALELIGRAAGRPEAGRQLRLEVEARVAALLRTVPAGPPKRVLWVFERDPDSLTGMVGLGPKGYLHGLIEMAGGINVLQGAPTAVPMVSAERVIRLAPDVILEHAVFYDHLGEGWRERVSKPWRELLGADAVGEGMGAKVRFVTDGSAVSPGPRLPDALALIIDLLHGPGASDVR